MSMNVSAKRIYAERKRAVRRHTPSGITMREVRAADGTAPELASLLDELDQALEAEAIDPAALAAVGKKLDQWAADNAADPAEPFAYAASAAAMAAPALKPEQHADLKTALGALSTLARPGAAPAAAPKP